VNPVSIDPENWSKLHGAATHFPIALMLVSAFCDGASLLAAPAEWRRGLRFAALITIVLGALGGNAAVASGLIMTKGQAWGHATMLRHHQFVWPAFALMNGLAAWRIATVRQLDLKPSVLYLALTGLAALLVSGAGYWGGELLNQG
jgi:uncharacterized membrane protein